jgi:hypothetical protein
LLWRFMAAEDVAPEEIGLSIVPGAGRTVTTMGSQLCGSLAGPIPPSRVLVACGGLLLGVLSWVAYEELAGGPALLGNSAALWLSWSWLVGGWEKSLLRAAGSGLLALLAIVTGFYSALYLIGNGGEHAATMTFWYLAALVGGPVFGLFGRLRHHPSSFLRSMSAPALGGAFLAEAATYHAVTDVFPPGVLATEAVVGLLVAFSMVRNRGDFLASLIWVTLLLLAGVLGWTAVVSLYRQVTG